MERLTEIKTHVTGFSYTDKKEGIFAQNVYAKLAAYEDTGLTPEQIQAQQQEIWEARQDRDSQQRIAIREMEKVKALTADKDEQAGRLIVLPCKVGDTVHVLTTDSLNGVEETSINRIVIKKNSIILNADCKNDDWGRAAWDFRPSDFGKTVFLTRESAEKALGGAEDAENTQT